MGRGAKMFRKVLKWIGVGLGLIVGVLVAGLAFVYLWTEARVTRVYTTPSETVLIPAHPSSTQRDWPLVIMSLCEECHGPNLAGMVLLDDDTGRLVSTNLTAGRGGIGATYTDAAWVRALRHGLDTTSRPLLGMPSELWYQLNDDDLGEIIAYVKGVPPVDNELPPTELRLMGRIMIVTGLLPPEVIAAELIDHDGPRPPAVPPGVTAEYGRYMANIMCANCHGTDLAGGPLEGEGRNLTPAGNLNGWTATDFINAVRTGNTPDGDVLDRMLMPWPYFRQMTDDELRAIWLYLRSLPPVEVESAE